MIIFEDAQIVIKTTGKNYDFIATIENKTNKEICIIFANDEIDPIVVNDWVGILADNNGYQSLAALQNSEFEVVQYT